MIIPKEFNGAKFINEPLKYIEVKDSYVTNEPQKDLNDFVIQEEEGYHKGFIEVIIPTGSYLGDYIDKLPYGIINKTETGIGGTTLELKTSRNSIIVEPTRAIAATKATDDILYVGSNYGSFKNNFKYSDWIDKIRAYCGANQPKYKKIVVVADSLPKVFDALSQEVENYFLLIDEIDIFQEGTFRPSLERCLDYYLKHPNNKRALISATINNFSNPKINKEPVTIFKYNRQIARTITVIQTNSIKRAVADKIREIFQTIRHTNYKLVIAYDVIEENLSIIEYLLSNDITKQDIGILCGYSSSNSVGEFYQELDKELKPITFITSAYFSGVDFNFKYHLICVSNQNIPHTSLSTSKMQQIAGRCRIKNGLLSYHIIYNLKKNVDAIIHPPVEDYINMGIHQVEALKCFKSHIFNSDLEFSSYLTMQEEISKAVNKQELGFTRIDFNNDPAVSFFKIDKLLEDRNTIISQYLTNKGLVRKLHRQGNIVSQIDLFYDDLETISNGEIYKKNRIVEISHALSLLKQYESHHQVSIDDLIRNSQNMKFAQKIYNQYKLLAGIVEHKDLIKKIEQFSSFRDERKYRSYVYKIKKFIAKDAIKKSILETFQIETTYNPKIISVIINGILEDNLVGILAQEETITYLKVFFDIKRTSENGYKILRLYKPEEKLIY